MYSVIIQNQNLMKEFQDYYPLFVELFQSGSVGCCTWVESGEDVFTALPGLTDLIEGKKEWRAVIVRSQNAESDGSFECRASNPYDYILNSEANIIRRYNLPSDSELYVPVEESPIPLIRLSQMLGGVPSPELRFVSDTINLDEGNKIPRKIFKPVPSEEDQKKYNDLVYKYEFDGKAPTEVVVITLRNAEPKSIREDTKAKWEIKREVEDTSDFCRRNRYSACTRFAVYDYYSQGRVQKEADLFNFWNSVMLLAREDIPASYFQAYRLYRIQTNFDVPALQEVLQEKMEQLIGCKRFIDREIASEIEKRLADKHPAPDYAMKIPVTVSMPDNISIYASDRNYEFCPSGNAEERAKWKTERSLTENNLKKIYVQSERALDDSSAAVRVYSKYPEDEIKFVDKYDRRLMEEQLSETFDNIVHMQTGLTSLKYKANQKNEYASERVVKAINKRVDKYSALKLGLCVLLSILVSCVPGILFYYKYDFGGLKGVLYSTLMMVLFMLATVLLILWWKRRNLFYSIFFYNKTMKENVDEIQENMEQFSEFVSNIVSHSRGKSYLNQLEMNRFDTETEIPNLQLHLKCVNKTLEMIKKWSECYNINLISDTDLDKDFPINYSILPQNNTFYTFEVGENYEIPLNDEGDHINSPFRFINGLTLVREELFKDD